jgi:hypothetical protein
MLAVAVTVMAVSWTGWRALRDLEGGTEEVRPEPVLSRPRLRLVEPAGAATS